MIDWLYFVKSNEDYYNAIKFLSKFERSGINSVSGLAYFAIEGPIHLRNGNSFGQDGDILIALYFTTHFMDIRKCVKKEDKIYLDSLIEYTDIEDKRIDMYYLKIKNSEFFVWEEDLIKYLELINFSF
jgi:hypothetical protein